MEIPLPPLEEQKRIVAKIEELFSKIDRIRELRKKAKEEAEILLKSALHHVFSKADEKGWKWVRLGNIVEINKRSINPAKEFPDRYFMYIDISSVESGIGRIKEVKKILGKNAPSRARRLIKVNDVLMSTVRPNLREFAIVPTEYDGQVCSTGFAVLTPKENILPKYILFCLFSDLLLKQYERMMLGAHYPALTTEQVKSLKIPLPFKNNKPDLEEQKRIAAYLDKIAQKQRKLLELYEQTEKELEVMKQAILNKAFRGELN